MSEHDREWVTLFNTRWWRWITFQALDETVVIPPRSLRVVLVKKRPYLVVPFHIQVVCVHPYVEKGHHVA